MQVHIFVLKLIFDSFTIIGQRVKYPVNVILEISSNSTLYYWRRVQNRIFSRQNRSCEIVKHSFKLHDHSKSMLIASKQSTFYGTAAEDENLKLSMNVINARISTLCDCYRVYFSLGCVREQSGRDWACRLTSVFAHVAVVSERRTIELFVPGEDKPNLVRCSTRSKDSEIRRFDYDF